MTLCRVMSSCHVMSSRKRLTLVCVHVNIHPPLSKTRIPASLESVHFNIPAPTHIASRTSKSGSKTPKSDQTKCHAPFSARKHVGMACRFLSFHVVINKHVHVNIHPRMSNTRIPASAESVHFNVPAPSHVASRTSKSDLKTPKIRPNKVPSPLFSPQACRGDMSL